MFLTIYLESESWFSNVALEYFISFIAKIVVLLSFA